MEVEIFNLYSIHNIVSILPHDKNKYRIPNRTGWNYYFSTEYENQERIYI